MIVLADLPEGEAVRILSRAEMCYVPVGSYTLPPGASFLAAHGKAEVSEDPDTGLVSVRLPRAGVWALVSGLLCRDGQDVPIVLVAKEVV